ncbi:MAG TPA: hypothetical protein VKG03_04375, partial [Solirubrobacterales bacterium]|nr:hypothetical protein [Solirubrobacterales bacterium]
MPWSGLGIGDFGRGRSAPGRRAGRHGRLPSAGAAGGDRPRVARTIATLDLHAGRVDGTGRNQNDGCFGDGGSAARCHHHAAVAALGQVPQQRHREQR